MKHPLIAIALLVLACAPEARAEWYWGEDAVMGTAIRVQLWHERAPDGPDAVAAVMEEMHRINDLMSTWVDDTELSRVNREAHAGPVTVSPELFALLDRSLRFSELTSGAFDITYASVGYLYDYRKGIKPDDAATNEALAHIDYRLVELDANAATVRFARKGVRVDLGGVAKGYAVERAAAILRARGVNHAIVSAGGDSRIIGDRRGRPWTVGVRDPRDADGIAVRLPLINEAVSTSGDYERFFELDGERHHHIISPSTGRSPSEVFSVTVLGPDGTQTDALSTGVFVLGVERGLALINRVAGYETVIYDREGRLHYSSGLEDGAASAIE